MTPNAFVGGQSRPSEPSVLKMAPIRTVGDAAPRQSSLVASIVTRYRATALVRRGLDALRARFVCFRTLPRSRWADTCAISRAGSKPPGEAELRRDQWHHLRTIVTSLGDLGVTTRRSIAVPLSVNCCATPGVGASGRMSATLPP
jgi:hypothetical protein